MAFDEDLAGRIRELLSTEDGLSEKRMFGGLGFMINGHMAVAASSRGGLMVRVAPQRGSELSSVGPAVQMEMQGRPMKGWLHLEASAVPTDRELARWVGYGVDHAKSLAEKKLD